MEEVNVSLGAVFVHSSEVWCRWHAGDQREWFPWSSAACERCRPSWIPLRDWVEYLKKDDYTHMLAKWFLFFFFNSTQSCVCVCVYMSLHWLEDISKMWFWVCFLLTLAHLVSSSVCWSEVIHLADTVFGYYAKFSFSFFFCAVDKTTQSFFS